MREQFQSACTERDRLLSEKNNSDLENTMLEELQTSLASVTEEREQLLEILKVNREEKNQLRRDLEEKEETVSEWSHSSSVRFNFDKDSHQKKKLLPLFTHSHHSKPV